MTAESSGTERCMQWVARDKAVIAPFSRVPYFPVAFKAGSGAVLEDVDGNRYIDFLSSASSQNLGYAHPAILEAVNAQMNDYTQVTNAYFYNPMAIRLAEKLAQITPGDGEKKVAFGLSGSDSIDGAIKLARAFTGRNKLISFQGAYHGSTFGALSVSFVSSQMRSKLGTLLPEVYPFAFPNPYHQGKGSGEECIANIRRAFDSWLPAGDVAAIIIEPLQGDGGMVVPDEGFFKALHDLCRQHGILLIDDEIQQGCMRTGQWLGIQHFGVVPDIVVMGKSLGGGLPLSAIIARSEIMDSLGPPAHLFTMGANATCCAAGLAMLEVMMAPGFKEGVVSRGQRLRQKLDCLAEKYGCIGDVRGLGLSIGVEIVSDRNAKTPDIAAAKKICYRAWQRGLLMICFAGNVLRVQPPLVITDEEIDRAADILDGALADLAAGRIPDSAADEVAGW